MANQNYTQVAELYAQGKLSWETDAIVALLYTDAVFDSAHKLTSELAGSRKAVAKVDGKYFVDGMALGLPAVFAKVSSGLEYQVVIAQDLGNNDPNVLAFIDTNTGDVPITVQNSGTLIVRPILPAEIYPGRPPTIGVWMRLPA